VEEPHDGSAFRHDSPGEDFYDSIFVLLLAMTNFVFAADPVDAVREAAQGWRQGAIKQDAAALQRYLADELVYTHGNGKRQTKVEYIAEVTKGAGSLRILHRKRHKHFGSMVRLPFSQAWLT